MDSVVLLHLLHTLAPGFDWRLSALHVHHGLSPNAGAWADFCRRLCAECGIPFDVAKVDIAPLRSEHGIEAAARKLRYAAFAKQEADFIALAHHADDQAETLMLQLLRGAGVRGAAAMPLTVPAVGQKAQILRPMLDIPRSVLLEYAQQHALHWVEDESNSDESYARNFLRHSVLPVLEQRFPAYRDTLSRSARHFAEAGELLDELARQDMQGWVSGHPVDISLLRAVSHGRAKNLLRYFLHVNQVPMPHDAQLAEMLHQLLDARENADVCVVSGNHQIRRYQNKVYVLPELGDFDASLVLPWRGESELEWPASNRRLSFTRMQGQGVSWEKLQTAPVSLRLRNGGETLRPHPNAASRSLKNLLQEHRVPPWQRERLPLLYCGDELVSVVGVAVAAAFQASKSESGLVVA
jgi:tRNA(Ile)-lysidine synthase